MLSIFHTNVSQEKFAEVSEVTTYNLAPVSIICTVGIRLAPKSSECSLNSFGHGFGSRYCRDILLLLKNRDW